MEKHNQFPFYAQYNSGIMVLSKTIINEDITLALLLSCIAVVFVYVNVLFYIFIVISYVKIYLK